ncbi:MAG: response regulator transcription factor [Chitinispirillaceae bacterium]|nr:response regulator transcription factor [Chitinispirillaceae bacterium]
MGHILVVEDDEAIQELEAYHLTKERFRVTRVATGEDAVRKLRTETFNLVLLDLMLPGIDGLEVCRSIRKNPVTESLPVMMVSAKGEESDIVSGLELGADDYIVKPFSPRVLIARIKALLRRKRKTEAAPSDAPIEIHGITILPGRHEVTVYGRPVDLTNMEFKVLHFLASQPGWVFTRYQIVEAVRGENYPVTDRSVDVLIVGLRKKLGKAGEYIETVRGVGYKCVEE